MCTERIWGLFRVQICSKNIFLKASSPLGEAWQSKKLALFIPHWGLYEKCCKMMVIIIKMTTIMTHCKGNGRWTISGKQLLSLKQKNPNFYFFLIHARKKNRQHLNWILLKINIKEETTEWLILKFNRQKLLFSNIYNSSLLALEHVLNGIFYPVLFSTFIINKMKWWF